jgi:hypothetical protein
MHRTVEIEVKNWLSQTSFEEAWIFGSLIHKNGAQFDSEISDVDLICRFEPPNTYFKRWKSVVQAVEPAGHLNLLLLRKLGREDASKPIVSIVPVSQLELDQGLHKDKAAQFFSHNNFYSVSTRKIATIGNEHRASEAKLDARFDAVREAQRYRNKMLSVAPSGARTVEPFEGPDVLPKNLSRCAAQIRWARQPKCNEEQRFDVNEGFVYMTQVLTARRNEASEVNDLLQRMMIRMGGRGAVGPLTPEDQLLLWEILSDDATLTLHFDEDDPPVKRTARRQVLPIAVREDDLPVKRTARRQILPIAVREEAFRRAGYCCCFPSCGVPLGVNGIGEIAFIVSPNPSGPRYDARYLKSVTSPLNNLLVLCPTHHRMIDNEPEMFPAKVLRKWNEIPRAKNPVFDADNLFTLVRLILSKMM